MTSIFIEDINDNLLMQFKEFAKKTGIYFSEYEKKSVNATTITTPKKLTPLDRQYFKEAKISEDFDDYLGDEFWLGEDA